MPSHYVPNTRIPTLVFPDSGQAARHVALLIETLIRQNNAADRPTVLGLATGSTPVGLYRELIRLHKQAELDFSRVVTFNLDEYFPMGKDDPHSYYRWMHETFFDHVNIPTANIRIPDGTVQLDDIEDFCARYEQAIRKAENLPAVQKGHFEPIVLLVPALYIVALWLHGADPEADLILALPPAPGDLKPLDPI
ncbi:MAG: 6-phosphogluconolactonase, partial [Gemmataceae bacterium]